MSSRSMIATVLLIPVLLAVAGPVAGKTRWGADYFPNVELTTHEGEKVRFYDDLVKDRVVAINFMFTSCKDVCPAEVARLRQVQKLLGERVGEDVFMYSISIDPEVDTPEVLKEYRSKFKVAPGWTFLTGSRKDIDLLQYKLGLLISDLDDPNDHNVSLVVGNAASGRWMKRSPYDNPKVLASLLGEALHNWKVPGQRERNDYATAPELPEFGRGEYIFRTRCEACHTIGQGDGVGPDLFGVVDERDPEWLARWLREPDVMVDEGDPLALSLLAEYGELRMPNFDLGDVEVAGLIEYMDAETRRLSELAARSEPAPDPHAAHRGHAGHDNHQHH